ncbi:carbohydrate kinase family protein [Allokutzneria sp. A3M-2-11 16]|uniref:carbohydrate kinase family protein n=1 Tax=Allokutzneria sp. A3M-2-11 16 TaxID=2962043 RepID=UPI0020B64CA2|nr:PfkB family carbohydrate kinase [Allokutzneria sp. A3M-2-11 16]MCP3803618.1 carbohydrate kinase family protein [Allokutzneria sp. A3M-2-11 16]
MAELDVVVVGGVGVDTIVRVGDLPLPVEDTIKVPPIRRYVGHTGNGVAMGCHALGLRTHFADVIGDDPDGALVLEHYRRVGLPFSHHVHPSGTRCAVNLVDRNGQRTSLYDGRHPDGMTVDPSLYRPLLRRTRHVHVSIVDWARDALAATEGVSTSTDLHNWDGVSEFRQDFAYGADLVFLSAGKLGDRMPAVVDDIFRRGRAKVVVVMDGGRGSHLCLPDSAPLHVPPVPVECVVDTNGAGDSYVAGFLYAFLMGREWGACARAGAAAGAHAVRSAGTHTSFISAAELGL